MKGHAHRKGGIRAIWLAAPLCLLAAQAATAQTGRAQFNPALTLAYRYTDNVLYVEGGDSDQSARVGVELPVTWQLKKGSTTLSYRGGYTWYDRSDELNHDGHILRWSLTTSPDRLSNLNVNVGYRKTQQQGASRETFEAQQAGEDTDTALSQRTDRQTYAARINYGRTTKSRWQWNIGAGGSRREFDPISGVPPDPGTIPVEDRWSYDGTAGLLKNLSRRTSLGASVRYRVTDLDSGTKEDVQQYGLVLDHTLSEYATLRFTLGGYSRDQDNVLPGSDIVDSGVYASVNYGSNRPVGPVRFDFGAYVQPSSGGSLAGTSTNSAVYFSVIGDQARYWAWRVGTEYARRKPSDEALPTLDTFAVGGTVDRNFRRTLALRLRARYVDQSSDDVGAPVGTFYTVSLGLVWYPRGRAERS
jgi:hypothetical protein